MRNKHRIKPLSSPKMLIGFKKFDSFIPLELYLKSNYKKKKNQYPTTLNQDNHWGTQFDSQILNIRKCANRIHKMPQGYLSKL